MRSGGPRGQCQFRARAMRAPRRAQVGAANVGGLDAPRPERPRHQLDKLGSWFTPQTSVHVYVGMLRPAIRQVNLPPGDYLWSAVEEVHGPGRTRRPSARARSRCQLRVSACQHSHDKSPSWRRLGLPALKCEGGSKAGPIAKAQTADGCEGGCHGGGVQQSQRKILKSLPGVVDDGCPDEDPGGVNRMHVAHLKGASKRATYS